MENKVTEKIGAGLPAAKTSLKQVIIKDLVRIRFYWRGRKYEHDYISIEIGQYKGVYYYATSFALEWCGRHSPLSDISDRSAPDYATAYKMAVDKLKKELQEIADRRPDNYSSKASALAALHMLDIDQQYDLFTKEIE